MRESLWGLSIVVAACLLFIIILSTLGGCSSAPPIEAEPVHELVAEAKPECPMSAERYCYKLGVMLSEKTKKPIQAVWIEEEGECYFFDVSDSKGPRKAER